MADDNEDSGEKWNEIKRKEKKHSNETNGNNYLVLKLLMTLLSLADYKAVLTFTFQLEPFKGHLKHSITITL